MINYGSNITVNIRIKMLAALAMKYPALYYMKKMGDNAGTNKKLTLLIIIDPPGVTKSMGHHFKSSLCWVVAPDPTINIYSISI